MNSTNFLNGQERVIRMGPRGGFYVAKNDGSKKRSVTFESSINPPSKRAKVDTSTATTTADLLGDLDDDSERTISIEK